ncbi:MAG: PAS domain S-box protein, partial [Methanolinea sp.]|nr:PAS domain S-box protein [Methanolinea sp.]
MFSLLVVDGDGDFISAFQSHASTWAGISIRTAGTEADAEELLAKGEYDAIISEYVLPGKDGIALLRHVRARYGEIPFIIVTGQGSEDVAVEASRYGITAYFKKGGDYNSLFNDIYGKTRHEVSRKERVQSLKARESRCRSILESHPGYICRIGPDMVITFINKAFSEITGISLEDSIGRPFSGYILPEDRDSFNSAVGNLTPEHPSRLSMIRLVPPPESDSSPVWTEWTFSAAFDPGGACAMVQGMGRDVSLEREISEREKQYLNDMEFLSRTAMVFLDLEDENDLYRFIVEKIHEMEPGSVVCVCATDMLNQTAVMKAVAGDSDIQQILTQEMGVNLIGFSFPLSEDPSARVQLQKKGFQEAPPLFYLFMQKFPPDACRRFEDVLSLEKNYLLGFSSQGEIFGQVIFAMRKGYELVNPELLEAFANQASVALLRLRTHKALRESEERYKAVIESQNELIYRFRPDGTHIFANDAFYRYFHTSREIVEGKQFIPE